MEPNNLETRARLERQLLFKPCPTREELQKWIIHFLGLDLPDCTVDESSNSNPLDFVWELYKQAVYDNDPDFDRVLAFANRGGCKCCEKGTLLLTKNDGLKKIEDIRVGEIIWSGWGWRKVTDWIHDGVKPGIRMDLKNGASLTGSKIHRVWARKRGEAPPDWIRISELSIADTVKFSTYDNVENSEWVEINSLSLVNDVDFYDLTVEQDHSYWSNGIISHNTLSASVIEILMVFHDQRSVVHLASVEEQSVNCLEYVKKQLRKPAFAPFITQNDARGIQITRYENQGVYLTPKEYQALPEIRKLEFQEIVSMIEIVVATPQSVNGKHSNFFCLDGDTKVFIKKPGNSKRKRTSRKIGRVFNKLAGLPTTGRKPVEVSEKFVDTPLEDVEVLGLDFSTGTMEFRKVLMAKRAKKGVLEIKTQKRTILCTPDHKLYILGKGYVEAKEVSPGDKVITINKGWSCGTEEVTEKSNDLKERVVYDITVEKNHNFFANGMLVHNCLDEIDLLDSDIVYQEASGIPVESKGKYPITFLTSTRKKATGRVQAEIDDSHKNGLRVRHWNQIDLTQSCDKSRHLPDEPKVLRYIDDDKLTHISKEEYEALAETEKLKLSPVDAFAGCIKNCKMLAACKTRLATHQKSKAAFLASIPFTQNKVTKGSIEFIKSQILCRKPLSTGAIFNRFSRDKHILTAKDIYRRIEQQEPPTVFGKAELVSHLLASPDVKFYGGMDFGYSHEFVAVVAAKVGIDFYIIECLAATELETTECIEYCKPLLKYRADFYPDPENPTLISSFRKARFNMVKWEKNKGSVNAGIEAVRAKLNPGPNAEPQLYLLLEDSGCGLLAEAFEKWSWKLNAAGEPTETPREEYKDRCDVVRYMILNAAPIKSRVYRPTENRKQPAKPASMSDRFWAAVKEDVNLKGVEIDPTPPDDGAPRRRKKFFY